MTDDIEKIDFEHADPERVVDLLEVLMDRDEDQDRGEKFTERERAQARARILSTVLPPTAPPPASNQGELETLEPESRRPDHRVLGRWAAVRQRLSATYEWWNRRRVERLCSRAERLNLTFTKIDVASSAHWETTSVDARKRLAQLTDTVHERICNGFADRLQRVSFCYAVVTLGLLLTATIILGGAVPVDFAPPGSDRMPRWVNSFGLAALVVGVQAWLGAAVGEHFRKSRLGVGAAVLLAPLSVLSGGVVYTHLDTSPAAVLSAVLAAACVGATPWLVALVKHSATAAEVLEIRRLRSVLSRRDARMLRAYRAAQRRLQSAERAIESMERRAARRRSDGHLEARLQLHATCLRARARVWQTLQSFSQQHQYLPTALELLAQMYAPVDKENSPAGAPLAIDTELQELIRKIDEG